MRAPLARMPSACSADAHRWNPLRYWPIGRAIVAARKEAAPARVQFRALTDSAGTRRFRPFPVGWAHRGEPRTSVRPSPPTSRAPARRYLTGDAIPGMGTRSQGPRVSQTGVPADAGSIGALLRRWRPAKPRWHAASGTSLAAPLPAGASAAFAHASVASNRRRLTGPIAARLSQ